MANDTKMFLCVKSNRFSYKITPQTAAGWRAFGSWMTAFFILTGLMVWGCVALKAKGYDDSLISWGIIFPFVILTLGWSVAMCRWMYVRSDILDLADIAAWKRERDAKVNKRNPR